MLVVCENHTIMTFCNTPVLATSTSYTEIMRIMRTLASALQHSEYEVITICGMSPNIASSNLDYSRHATSVWQCGDVEFSPDRDREGLLPAFKPPICEGGEGMPRHWAFTDYCLSIVQCFFHVWFTVKRSCFQLINTLPSAPCANFSNYMNIIICRLVLNTFGSQKFRALI